MRLFRIAALFIPYHWVSKVFAKEDYETDTRSHNLYVKKLAEKGFLVQTFKAA
jgi:hypothetical protein